LQINEDTVKRSLTAQDINPIAYVPLNIIFCLGPDSKPGQYH